MSSPSRHRDDDEEFESQPVIKRNKKAPAVSDEDEDFPPASQPVQSNMIVKETQASSYIADDPVDSQVNGQAHEDQVYPTQPLPDGEPKSDSHSQANGHTHEEPVDSQVDVLTRQNGVHSTQPEPEPQPKSQSQSQSQSQTQSDAEPSFTLRSHDNEAREEVKTTSVPRAQENKRVEETDDFRDMVTVRADGLTEGFLFRKGLLNFQQNVSGTFKVELPGDQQVSYSLRLPLTHQLIMEGCSTGHDANEPEVMMLLSERRLALFSPFKTTTTKRFDYELPLVLQFGPIAGTPFQPPCTSICTSPSQRSVLVAANCSLLWFNYDHVVRDIRKKDTCQASVAFAIPSRGVRNNFLDISAAKNVLLFGGEDVLYTLEGFNPHQFENERLFNEPNLGYSVPLATDMELSEKKAMAHFHQQRDLVSACFLDELNLVCLADASTNKVTAFHDLRFDPKSSQAFSFDTSTCKVRKGTVVQVTKVPEAHYMLVVHDNKGSSVYFDIRNLNTPINSTTSPKALPTDHIDATQPDNNGRVVVCPGNVHVAFNTVQLFCLKRMQWPVGTVTV